MRLDFYLSTRVPLGPNVIEMLRVFINASRNTSELGGASPAPGPHSKLCSNLKRRHLSRGAGFNGGARLNFPDEVNAPLALHQRDTPEIGWT